MNKALKQLPIEFQDLKKNSKELLLEQLSTIKKEQGSNMDVFDLLNSLITSEDIKQIGGLLKKITTWRIKFQDTFMEDMQEQIEQSLDIFTYIKVIGDGFFCQQSPLTQTSQVSSLHFEQLQNYFLCVTPEHYNIYYEVGVVKKPRLKKNEFDGFDYLHQMTFIGVKMDGKMDEILQRIIKYHNNLKLNPYRLNIAEINCESTTTIQKKQKQFYTEKSLFRWNEESKWGELQFMQSAGDTKCIKWLPSEIQSIKLPVEQLKLYDYDSEFCQWITEDERKLITQSDQKMDISLQNKYLLQQYADFDSAAKIIDIMQQLPDFKIMITQQEREVIASKTNSLIIGRSGTGKTTCTVLRMFALQMLLKIRQKFFNQQNEMILWDSVNPGKKVEFHCIFTTQNPVLIGEVRKYYKKLLLHIQESIKRNQEKQHCGQEINSLDQSMISNSSFQIIDMINESSISMILQEDTHLIQNMEQEQDEDIDEEDDELDQIDNLNSLQQMTEDQFPSFISIKKLLFLIDASLGNPFFELSRFQVNGKKIGRAGWNNGKTIKITKKLKTEKTINILEIDEDAQYEEEEFTMMNQSELQKQMEETKIHDKKQAEKLIQDEGQQQDLQIIEVDYDYFLKRFWPTVKKQGHKYGADEYSLPTFVWTQIYSYIKGSQFSYSYPQQYLPKYIYAQMNPCNLNDETIKLIYDYFLDYEKWKLSSGIFDMMDLVNYQICEIDKGKLKAIPIHYLFVDEVQDLPHAVLELFSRLIEQGYFFCGDTAQNIVKGVGFRFQDLKNLFKNSSNPLQQQLTTLQLTINFRSHNNILQMANSLVSLIELFFPKAIDRLNKEVSDLNGPLPVIMEDNDMDFLFQVLKGDISIFCNTARGIPIEFGCNQVVLVKDQEAKNNIPAVLQHALILTVYESKGLEFEDVILFNFFSDNSILQSQWDLLDHVCTEKIEVDRDEYNFKLTRHLNQQIDLENPQDITYTAQTETGKVMVQKLRLKPSIKAVDLNNYTALCNELKQLYVAVTRAKNRIIIFDENKEKRTKIQQLWNQLKLIEILDQNNYQNHQKDIQKIIASNTKEEWNAVGLKMFANKFYDQAVKCFEMAENNLLKAKSKAFMCALKGQTLYFESKDQEYKDKANQLLKESLDNFSTAGYEFQKCNLMAQAAACFFSGQKYELSLTHYIISKKWNEAGEAALKCSRFDIAGLLFLKAQNYSRCFEAFLQHNNNLLSLFLLSKIKIYLQDNVEKKVRQLLPETLKDCFNEYTKITQTRYADQAGLYIEKEFFYSGLPCDFAIIKKNCPIFYDEFSLQLQIIKNKVSLRDKDEFYNTMISFIRLFINELLFLLSNVFINYETDVIRQSILCEEIEFTNQRNAFILDILEYFELRKIQLFFYDYIHSDERDNYLISTLYYISPLYQPLQNQISFTNDSNLRNQKNRKEYYQRTIFQTRDLALQFPLGNSKKKLLTNYAICQIGLYEIASENMISQIQSLQQQGQYNMQERAKLNTTINCLWDILLFFQDRKQLLTISNFQQYNSSNQIQQHLGLFFKKVFSQKQNKLEVIYTKILSINFTELNEIKQILLLFRTDQVIYSQIFEDLFDTNNLNTDGRKIITLALVPLINNNMKCSLYQSLLKLNFTQFQLFVIELQKVVDLFRYNQRITDQQRTNQCISSIFQISIPTTDTLKYISQSYIAVHKCSYIFEYLVNNYKQQNSQSFQIDIKGKIFLFSSTFVIKRIQSIYSLFLKSYVADYCLLKTVAEFKIPFLIKLYPYCVLKLHPKKYESKSFEKDQYFKQTQADEVLVHCLQGQLCDEIFNLWYQIPKATYEENTIIYDELATAYFVKALSDQTIKDMHLHILTAIHSLHIAQYYDKSFQFIENLINARHKNEEMYQWKNNRNFAILNLSEQHPFLTIEELSCYKLYIEYLMASNVSMSINTIQSYLKYHLGLTSILFQEQIFRDLTFCTLTYIICQRASEIINEYNNLRSQNSYLTEQTYKFSIQLLLHKKISTFLKTKIEQQIGSVQPQLMEQYILITNWDQTDQNNYKLIESLFQLIEKGENHGLTLLIAIIINIKTIPFQIQQELERLLERIGQSKKQQKQRNILIELSNLIKIEYELRQSEVLQIIEKQYEFFEYIQPLQISCKTITNEIYNQKIRQIKQYCYSYNQINSQLEDELFEQQQKIFKSSYIGMRFITFKSLKNRFIDNELLLEESSAEIYDQINLIRNQLFEIIYIKSLQKSVNFHSIIQELDRLSNYESYLDEEFYKRSKGNLGYHWRKLRKFENEIEKWRNDNNQLAGKFDLLERQNYQNQWKKTTAMCFLQSKRNKRY